MKPKRFKPVTALFIKLECQYCGKIFRTERFKKYCSPTCRKHANRVRVGLKYRQMRAAYYKAMEGKSYSKVLKTQK